MRYVSDFFLITRKALSLASVPDWPGLKKDKRNEKEMIKQSHSASCRTLNVGDPVVGPDAGKQGVDAMRQPA
jgi:hypothetical protein